jgi:hypothetical protein
MRSPWTLAWAGGQRDIKGYNVSEIRRTLPLIIIHRPAPAAGVVPSHFQHVTVGGHFMRVKTLVVINFCDEFSNTTARAEDRDAALALYNKHVNRTGELAAFKPTQSWLIEVKNDTATGNAMTTDEHALQAGVEYRVVQPSSGTLPAKIDTDDTGVYLVFHAKQSTDPNIFGVVSLGKAEKKSTQAKRLVGTLKKLGIVKIRKLCLVACNVTNDKTAASKNFLVNVGKELQSWPKDARPLIAGYEDYVYVKSDGTKSKDAGGSQPMKGSGLKQVWVCKKTLMIGGYEKVALETSGWSDRAVQEANTGEATVH